MRHFNWLEIFCLAGRFFQWHFFPRTFWFPDRVRGTSTNQPAKKRPPKPIRFNKYASESPCCLREKKRERMTFLLLDFRECSSALHCLPGWAFLFQASICYAKHEWPSAGECWLFPNCSCYLKWLKFLCNELTRQSNSHTAHRCCSMH